MAPTSVITVMEAYRRAKRLSQLDLAIQVGVTQAVISQYERGYLIGIQTETMRKIAEILGLDNSDDLLKDVIEYEIERRKALGV